MIILLIFDCAVPCSRFRCWQFGGDSFVSPGGR